MHTGGVKRRLLAAWLLAAVSACSGAGEPEREPTPESPPVSTAVSPPVSPSPSANVPPNPVSLPALMEREYVGADLRLGREVASTSAYRQHTVTYRSGRLRISGLLNVPRGRGPFPALVLAHGYIDPAIYTNGRGMRREQDWLARAGFVTLHVDYRNHAGSDRDPAAEADLRLGYTEDVINAVLALRAWSGPVDDGRIGLVGRSMGGGVVYNVLTVQPGLVDAGVVFAPVSSDTVDNFERWIRRGAGRATLAAEIVRRHGDPRTNPGFWRGVSPRTYFDRVSEPVLIHHGTSDDSCPIRWSRATTTALRKAGADVTLHVYEGEEHAFGPQWPLSMERTTAFLRANLA